MNQTTVYLIDDEPVMMEILCEMVKLIGLKTKGYTRASHFFEEVEFVEDGSILVLDLNMPEMDGIVVIRQLAKMKKPPALILVSGHDSGVLSSAEKLGRAHNLDIIASLCKPVSLDQFQQLLQQYVLDQDKSQLTSTQSAEYEFTSTELQHAIFNEQMKLNYQPQFNLATGKLTGVEALVFWQHPIKGIIHPEQFIAIAEQNGWMKKLTNWVIDTAAKQERLWHDAGYMVSVSVNISANCITSLSLPEHISDLLANNKLDPTHLILEITESALMGELVTSLDILTRLRLKGIGLSIDDFGTGYSSLSQLHRVPFTELKIDRSFVSAMTDDDEARAIVKTCILLGHELKMMVVAEGVETEEHLEALKQLGCDTVQGYLLSRPLSAEKITDTLKEHSVRFD